MLNKVLLALVGFAGVEARSDFVNMQSLMSLHAKLSNAQQQLYNLQKTKSSTPRDGGAVAEFTQVAEDLRDAMEQTSHLQLTNIEPIINMISFLEDSDTMSQVIGYASGEYTQGLTSYSQALNNIYEIGRNMIQIGTQAESSIRNTVNSLNDRNINSAIMQLSQVVGQVKYKLNSIVEAAKNINKELDVGEINVIAMELKTRDGHDAELEKIIAEGEPIQVLVDDCKAKKELTMEKKSEEHPDGWTHAEVVHCNTQKAYLVRNDVDQEKLKTKKVAFESVTEMTKDIRGMFKKHEALKFHLETGTLPQFAGNEMASKYLKQKSKKFAGILEEAGEQSSTLTEMGTKYSQRAREAMSIILLI